MTQIWQGWHRLWGRHEVRYLVVAGCVSVLSWALVGLGLWFGWHYMAATVFSQLAPIPVAFPAYRGLIFRSTGRVLADFVRFCSVWVSGMVAAIGGAPVMVELVGLDPVSAQVVITALVAVGSYLAHRFFTFRRRKEAA